MVSVHGGNLTNVSTLVKVLDFVGPVGGSYWLLGSWLPPLLAVASHGLSLLEIDQLLDKAWPVRPHGDREELDMIGREFLRRPAYGFTGW